jgi:hypothetical protein
MIENDNGGCKAGLRGLAEFLGSGPERGGSAGSYLPGWPQGS